MSERKLSEDKERRIKEVIREWQQEAEVVLNKPREKPRAGEYMLDGPCTKELRELQEKYEKKIKEIKESS